MGTKSNPGEHDCYAKAEPDEPMFVLLARDPLAANLVREWASRYTIRKLEAFEDVDSPAITPEKLRQILAKADEARVCADAMDRWMVEHPDA